jgi:hypothetical protein
MRFKELGPAKEIKQLGSATEKAKKPSVGSSAGVMI